MSNPCPHKTGDGDEPFTGGLVNKAIEVQSLRRMYAREEGQAMNERRSNGDNKLLRGLSDRIWWIAANVAGDPKAEEKFDEALKQYAKAWQAALSPAPPVPDVEVVTLDYGKGPCGHDGRYLYTEDGGKHVNCLLCEFKRAGVSPAGTGQPDKRICGNCGLPLEEGEGETAKKLSRELSAVAGDNIRHDEVGTSPADSQGKTLMPATNSSAPSPEELAREIISYVAWNYTSAEERDVAHVAALLRPRMERAERWIPVIAALLRPRMERAERWIPVSERLPEKDETVLMFGELSLEPWLGFHSGTEWLYAGSASPVAPYNAVAYWRPLPTPPREGEGA